MSQLRVPSPLTGSNQCDVGEWDAPLDDRERHLMLTLGATSLDDAPPKPTTRMPDVDQPHTR